jgi:hypothetical protein
MQRRRPKESAPLIGEEVDLIRPYLLVWESASETERENRRLDAAEVAA